MKFHSETVSSGGGQGVFEGFSKIPPKPSVRPEVAVFLKKARAVTKKVVARGRSLEGIRLAPPSELRIDLRRAETVLGTLRESSREGRHLFDQVSRGTHAPQWTQIPDGMEQGSMEHIIYLVFVVMTDRRDESMRLYEGHRELWRIRPYLYGPEAMSVDPAKLARILKQRKIGMPETSAKCWLRVARTLFETLGGNPLRLYDSGKINDILMLKRQGKLDLPGFGPKILSLLALFYAELGLIGMPSDAFPVDVHVQRLAISTGIISGGNACFRNEVMEKKLRPLLCRVSTANAWPTIDLSHDIWLLGNQMCGRCYKNPHAPTRCPVYDLCHGAISARNYFQKGIWDLGARRHRKGGDRVLRLPEGGLWK